MATINYELNKVTGMYEPTLYPVKPYNDMRIPETISMDFNRLTALTEDKYTKEYLKVCAFYNKLFPSLKHYDWSRSTYNSIPFTVQDQERADTGTGLSSNYLKSAVDLIVARIGNNVFDYHLLADQPTVLYTVYREEIERLLKSFIRQSDLNTMAIQNFHDAAILGFGHAFVDPWTETIRKVADWEFSCYESEFSEKQLKRVMIRDFAFPVAGLGPYAKGFPKERLEEFARSNSHVDLRLYIDCFRHQKYVAINNEMSEATEYPFDEVLIATLSWDIGVERVLVASAFDILYPLQRQINKLLAKKTQLLAMYKGPVPVFSGDADLVVKQLSNGAGEALFLDTQRKPGDFFTVLEPTPLDAGMNAELEALKASIFELAGVQQISMDVENYRSAAAVVALDQMRDSGFQSQLTALATFIKDCALCYIKYKAAVAQEAVSGITWAEIEKLLHDSYIEIKPVHPTAQDDGTSKEPQPVDHMMRHVEQFLMGVAKGTMTFADVDYSYDYALLEQQGAMRLVEYRALHPDSDAPLKRLETFMVACFIQDIQDGKVDLLSIEEADVPPPQEEVPSV